MSASEEHATAVNTALAEAETLVAESEGKLEDAVNGAAAAVAAVIDILQNVVTRLASQADTSDTAAQNTLGPAEAHVNATHSAGHGTLGHVLNAQEACQYAVSNATGVKEYFDTLQGAVAETRNVAVTALMSLLPQLEDGVNGTKTVVEHLQEAQAQITLAQTPR